MKALVLALLVVMPAYAEDKPPKPKAAVGATAMLDRPAAMVGGKVLWESHVVDRMGVGEKGDRAKIVEEMIDEMLWLRHAAELGVTVDDGEVKLALEEIKKENSLDDAGLDKVLAAQGYSRARYQVELKRQLMILRTKHRAIGQERAKDQREAAAAAWLAKERKRVHIERWP